MKRKEWRCRRSQRVYKVQVFKKIIIIIFFLLFGHALQHVEFQFTNQVLNPCPLQ